MNMKNRVSPFLQLQRMLQTQKQHDILLMMAEPLSDEYRDDFCLACVAYIRFGIRRHFPQRIDAGAVCRLLRSA
ncbi:MAG: hypothetical protein PUB62_10605 [Prevotellaceae bacterium]|nr:hypothetical protein [Prevotellaceae bacterium]MDY6100017.1 hypothetical protein [Bacteroidaceae bacterium]